MQLTIFHHWFRWWLGADQATSHYLNQWWFDYWHIYVSLGLNELKHVNPSGAETRMFWINCVNIMAPWITRTPAIIILIMQVKKVLVFHGKEFLQPVPIQCWEMIEHANLVAHFPEMISPLSWLTRMMCLGNANDKLSEQNMLTSQNPQCIRQISHNAPFCNRNMHMCAYFCYKMVHCGTWDWCIMGFVWLV